MLVKTVPELDARIPRDIGVRSDPPLPPLSELLPSSPPGFTHVALIPTAYALLRLEEQYCYYWHQFSYLYIGLPFTVPYSRLPGKMAEQLVSAALERWKPPHHSDARGDVMANPVMRCKQLTAYRPKVRFQIVTWRKCRCS